ncbi:MAG: hypothetical protein PUE01_04870 [Clostridiaceae bacterium]|nr:hypothetical protein [Clostridiaceae bacterium]
MAFILNDVALNKIIASFLDIFKERFTMFMTLKEIKIKYFFKNYLMI